MQYRAFDYCILAKRVVWLEDQIGRSDRHSLILVGTGFKNNENAIRCALRVNKL